MPSFHLASFIDEFATTGPVEIDPGEVLAALVGLRDPRKKRGVRHRVAHLLVIMVCSVLAGATTLVEMAEWATDTARDQLAAPGIGAPHATTWARVLQRLNTDTLDRLAGSWAQGMTAVAAIAIDGKEVRGAKNGGGTRVHLLAGIDHTTAAVLVRKNVSEKPMRPPFFLPVLEGIKDLRDVVISADALHTQRVHAEYLHTRGARYVLTVKANQPKLRHQLGSLPWMQVRAGHKTRNTANGREIERTVKCVSFDVGIKFPHAAQAAQITRRSRPLGTRKWSTETVHVVTSLAPAQGKPDLIGSLVRGHWGIENAPALAPRRDLARRQFPDSAGQRPACHGLPAQHRDHDPAPGRRNQPCQSHPRRTQVPAPCPQTHRPVYQLNDFADAL
ncbi:ISAs1 family transposase, partial [Arthrobacter sp. SDTb3-6]|nr:ISAs1 family transposase [Arthrobacter sp. SDTb3-6]